MFCWYIEFLAFSCFSLQKLLKFRISWNARQACVLALSAKTTEDLLVFMNVICIDLYIYVECKNDFTCMYRYMYSSETGCMIAYNRQHEF